MTDHIKPQHVVVNLICVLVETTESVDLVVPTICNGGVNQTGWSLAESSGDGRSIAIRMHPTLHGRIRHKEGVIGRSCRAWGKLWKGNLAIRVVGGGSEDGGVSSGWS